MSVLTANQRARLTKEERERAGQLVVSIVHGKLTEAEKKELIALKQKMGPR